MFLLFKNCSGILSDVGDLQNIPQWNGNLLNPQDTKINKGSVTPMDKEKALQHLIESGFKAYNENGVVMVDCDDRKTARKVSEELASIDYHCSFGFRFATA